MSPIKKFRLFSLIVFILMVLAAILSQAKATPVLFEKIAKEFPCHYHSKVAWVKIVAPFNF